MPLLRTPGNYQGTKPTGKKIDELLPQLLEQLDIKYRDCPEQILAAWPKIIGEPFAVMTKAVSFKEGILAIKVNNSALYSELSLHRKEQLLKKIREMFPKVEIRTLSFRIG